MVDDGDLEKPLKQSTVTTRIGQADDMVNRGGLVATSVKSPTIMRKEQKSVSTLAVHKLSNIEPSNRN